jgi:hypothetical protein
MISQTLDGCLDRIAVRAAAAAGKPQPEESPRKPKRRLQLRLVR